MRTCDGSGGGNGCWMVSGFYRHAEVGDLQIKRGSIFGVLVGGIRSTMGDCRCVITFLSGDVWLFTEM